MATIITTWIDDKPTRHGEDFEAAAVQWDRETHMRGCAVSGGISIQQYDAAGLMTRDGWLVHVRPDGTVYVSPRALVLA